MQVSPVTADWTLAREIHAEFSGRPGAQCIASEFSLAHLSAVLSTARPASVLEFGAGIGTITRLLLRHPHSPARLTATEGHPFCIEQFAQNIPADYAGRYTLVTDWQALVPDEGGYDLVIYDGLLDWQAYSLLRPGTVCFVDGARASTRTQIDEVLAAKGLECPFANYNRGTRYCVFYLRYDTRTGRRSPRFKFRKVLKGCWIGRVVAAPGRDAAAGGKTAA